MDKTLIFGYPESCVICKFCAECKQKGLKLQVKPYFRPGDSFRLMLIGQDPTIFQKKERVKKVLMLNEENGQLTRWLKSIFGEEKFNSITIYATNLVKCTFEKPPSTYRGKHFLRPYFENCKKYLIEEIKSFKPSLILTFGEPSHRYCNQIFDIEDKIGDTMQQAFGTSQGFFQVSWEGISFKYSPALHIKTYRVAEIYGDKVKNFKSALKKELSGSNLNQYEQ